MMRVPVTPCVTGHPSRAIDPKGTRHSANLAGAPEDALGTACAAGRLADLNRVRPERASEN